MMRPGVVWFGEELPKVPWEQAAAAATSADVFVVIGTSALVQPAAHLPRLAKQHGARLIEINSELTPLSLLADLTMIGKAGEVLGELYKSPLT
jgi:NAD-dependent deacetylase